MQHFPSKFVLKGKLSALTNRNSLFLLITLLSLLIITCKSGDEVLATFNGGEVKRKDLREFYATREIPINENTANLKNQTGVLENISVQTIIENDYRKQGLFEKEKIKALLELSEKQYLVSLYRKNFLEKAKKDETLDFAYGQMVVIQKNPNGASNKERADKIISDLNNAKSDKDIIAIISKETDEDGRKPVGGLIEPQCMNCKGENIIREILKKSYSSNAIGKFESVEMEGTTFLVRLIEVKKLKSDKVTDYLSDKLFEFKSIAMNYEKEHPNEKQLTEYYVTDEAKIKEKANMIKDHFMKGFDEELWSKEYKSLLDKSGIIISDVLKNSLNEKEFVEDTILYTRGDKKYTFGQLAADYRRVDMSEEQKMNPSEMIYFFNSIILPIEIIGSSPDLTSIKSSEAFITGTTLIRRNIAWTFYMRDLEKTEVKITDDEIKATYEAGKLYSYVRPKAGDPNKTEPIPFNEAKDRIVKEIRETRLKSIFQKNIQKIKTDNNIKIEVEKLKEGTI